MPEKDHESTKCCVCKKSYEEGEVKVKNHDDITGKHQESVHQDCSLNLDISCRNCKI